MSEINLNEAVEEVVQDATVMTVNIDDTLTVSGEAADAKAVGDALAQKANIDDVNTIDVNGEEADNQGHIILTGEHIPMSSSDTTKLNAAIAAAAARTAADIPMSSDPSAQTIADVLSGVTAQTAATIPMTADTSSATIGETIGTLSATVGSATVDIAALQAKTGNAILLGDGTATTIKAAVEERVKSVNGITPNSTGNVTLNSVPTADNLNSTVNQSTADTYMFRTSGGNTSVKTGEASVSTIKGSNVHTGYSAPVADAVSSNDELTVSINVNTFLGQMTSASGEAEFTYDGSWKLNGSAVDLATYGITVSGTPENSDTITVTYAKEVRGTITQSNPQSFVATGWNLAKYTTAYSGYTNLAKVKKYSADRGYGISGTYTSIYYSATLTGEKTAVTVTAGKFQISADGYIWLTGGNNTDTAIWITWEDWLNEPNGGTWEAYSDTVIDLSGVMGLYFSNGLMKAGGYQDEINLSTGKAYSRVARLAYSAENLATVIALGTDYEYDEDYIWYGKASADEYTITTGNSYAVNDHGTEYFTGTDIGVYALQIYGNNLKNKLERDTLTISSQELTDAQKATARANIAAAEASLLDPLVIIKSYSCTYSVGASTNASITASNLGVTAIDGYTPTAIKYLTTGNQHVVPYLWSPTTSGNVVCVRNVSSSAQNNKTMSVKIEWMRNEVVQAD